MGDSHKMGRRKGRGSTMQGNNHSFLSETVRGGYITNVRLKRLPHQKSGIPSTFDVAAINDRSFGQKVPSKTTHTHTHTHKAHNGVYWHATKKGAAGNELWGINFVISWPRLPRRFSYKQSRIGVLCSYSHTVLSFEVGVLVGDWRIQGYSSKLWSLFLCLVRGRITSAILFRLFLILTHDTYFSHKVLHT